MQSIVTSMLAKFYPDQTFVILSVEEHESLLEDSRWLAALENAGVDNWQGIDFARELLRTN